MDLPKSLINKIKRTLPELCSVNDLIRIGVYRSEQAAYAARKAGNAPAHFRLPFRGFVYPREGIIDFLKVQAAGSKVSSRIENAQISHSEAPPLCHKPKDRTT